MGIDACAPQVLLGPILLDEEPGLSPDGAPCSTFERVTLRVRVARVIDGVARPDRGWVVDETVQCGTGSSYARLPSLPPGTYDVAVEAVGTPLLMGGDLVGAPCPVFDAPGSDLLFRPNRCVPIRFDVAPCDLAVAAVTLGCRDETGATCLLE